MKPWKPILAALVIFAAGVAIGHLALPDQAAASDTNQRRESWRSGKGGFDRRGGPSGRPSWSPVMSEEQISGICGRMTHDLDLTASQSNQISTILKGSQTRMKAIADEFLPRTRDEFRQTREAIQAVLTEEQRQEFQEGWKRRHSREGRFRDNTNAGSFTPPVRPPAENGHRPPQPAPDSPPRPPAP